jgi:hypothetical protein
MEATADTLLNQVANLFLSKIDKQNIDPKFLKKFTEQLLGKFSYTSSEPIKQKPASPNDGTGGSLVKDLKKVYNDLVKETTYKENYKKFLRYVLPDELLKQSTDNVTSSAEKPEIKTVDKTIEKPEIKSAPQMNEGRADLIKDAPTEQKVIFDGFSERGWAFFSERLPKILKGIIPASKPDAPKEGSGLGLLGGGIALLLGGLAALVTGLMTDGPFKGLLKILSKVGIQGGIKMLEVAAKIFIGSLKQVIMAPINLLDDAAKLIGKIFGKEAYKAVLKPLRGMTGLFTKMLGGLVRFVTPLLKKLPLIGTVISWGFAYTRFRSGDTVGGIIDILSGIASIFPGVGTAIAIGLDVLNAFLDYKAGGADGKASQKKTGMIGDFFGNIWEWIKGKAIGVFSWFIDLGDLVARARWGDVFLKLAGWVPGLDWMLGWLGTSTEEMVEEGNTMGQQYVDIITSFTNWVQTNIIDKITGFVGSVWDKIKTVASYIPFLGGDDEPDIPQTPESTKQTRKTARGRAKIADQTETLTPMAEGGIVTEPTKAIVGEAGPEAVLPLDKYFDPQNLSLNNTTLEQIAGNTKDTNKALNGLTDAIIRMVGAFNQKASVQGSTTVINAGGGSKDATSASMAANFNLDPIRRVRSQFAV